MSKEIKYDRRHFSGNTLMTFGAAGLAMIGFENTLSVKKNSAVDGYSN
jgi:hypothetical protein